MAVVPDESTASLDLHGKGPHALGAVRRWLGVELADLSRDCVVDVIQVADELTSNAFEHAGGPSTIRVTHDHAASLVTVEVEDEHPAAPTLGRSRFGPGAHRGRGMVLINELSCSWGVRGPTADHHTKTVWARVSCVEEP
jgi:two-component sensor histidine kinase